ncbi:MAG: NAD(P)/FAD-dependent oxidoreductase [Armatimonadetes bacterium]|nr:NAD(P)/FAD-dependent oxidoreductase [Armatimonadota bacterium]
MDADVIVVGAGPAGSATALRLARRGYRVTIIDRARFPRVKPCGEYLNPGAVAALKRLGVAEEIVAAGTALSGMFVAGSDGTTVWAAFPAGFGLLVPRARLDHLLLLQAARAGADVIEACRVAAAFPGARPAVAVRHAGRTVRLTARLVIGADGLRSVVARRAGPLMPVANGCYTIGAYFERLNVTGPRGDLHLGPGWYAGAALYGHGIGNVVAAAPRAFFQRVGGDPERAFAAACAGLPALARIVRGARRLTPFVSVGPLGYARRRATDDGILLVGDAAGTIDPMTGQGIALALRGAELAAEVADAALRCGDASARALRGYERARAQTFGDVWRASRILQWIGRRPRLATHLLRRLALKPRLATWLLGALSEP